MCRQKDGFRWSGHGLNGYLPRNTLCHASVGSSVLTCIQHLAASIDFSAGTETIFFLSDAAVSDGAIVFSILGGSHWALIRSLSSGMNPRKSVSNSSCVIQRNSLGGTE